MTQVGSCHLTKCAPRLLLFVFLCGAAWGQNAVVSGRVTDTTGGVIPNVAVVLINRATQVKSPTVTTRKAFLFSRQSFRALTMSTPPLRDSMPAT